MSALTDLFTAMANKIRSKTGTQTTYTPSEMVSDGIDDVFDAGVASVPQPTSITPSTSSPVSLTADTPVKPTASGVAIAAYADIQPSNSNPPVLVKPADPSTPPYICRIVTNSGYAILSYSSITPSNSSPVSLSSGSFYKPSASGFAISSYSSKTPSTTNRSYESLSSGTINKINTRTGYLYGAIPTGRVLFSWSSQPTANTSWTDFDFTGTAYDADASTFTTLLDDNFAHIDGNGDIVVDRAIPTAYIAGIAWYGRTSSGTAVYSGIRMLKNGTVITGASAYGSSSDNSPGFRRIETSFAVGDVISVQRRTSSTSSSTVKTSINITTP